MILTSSFPAEFPHMNAWSASPYGELTDVSPLITILRYMHLNILRPG